MSDRHKLMYYRWKSEGLSDEEIINRVPKQIRAQFIADIKKTPTESHYGVKDKWFYQGLIATGIILILLLLFTMGCSVHRPRYEGTDFTKPSKENRK